MPRGISFLKSYLEHSMKIPWMFHMNIFIIKGEREISFFFKKCHWLAIAPCIYIYVYIYIYDDRSVWLFFLPEKACRMSCIATPHARQENCSYCYMEIRNMSGYIHNIVFRYTYVWFFFIPLLTPDKGKVCRGGERGGELSQDLESNYNIY